MISLADLRARNVLPMWQEGVAVVQELLHTVVATQGSAERLPDLEHVALIANGDVVALPGGPVPVHPVRHLAILLQLLLEGVPVPPELQSFLENNVADPPQFSSVEEFSKQLSFFERPGRKADVERLVARAAASDAQTRADEELRRLKEKAQQAAESKSAENEPAAKRRSRRGVPVPVIAFAVILATIASGGVWWWQRNQPVDATVTGDGAPAIDGTPAATGSAAASANGTSSPAADAGAPAAAPAAQPATTSSSDDGSLLGRTRDVVSRVVHTAMEKIAGPSSPVAAAPVEKTADAAPVKRRRARRSDIEIPAASAGASPAAPGVTVSATEVAGSVVPPSLVADIPALVPSEVPSIIYRPGDPGVEPAVLMRPVLPRQPPPDVPPDKVGTLEVVVNEQGDVDAVKLISPGNRYQERMLVSAAKTWKFRPATKDGHPVRYRTTVRLTI